MIGAGQYEKEQHRDQSVEKSKSYLQCNIYVVETKDSVILGNKLNKTKQTKTKKPNGKELIH